MVTKKAKLIMKNRNTFVFIIIFAISSCVFGVTRAAGFELKTRSPFFWCFGLHFLRVLENGLDVEEKLYRGVDMCHFYFNVDLYPSSKNLLFRIASYCWLHDRYCHHSNYISVLARAGQIHFLDMSDYYIPSHYSLFFLSNLGNVINNNYKNNSITNQRIRVLDFFNPVCTNLTGITVSGFLPENIETQAVLNIDLPPGAIYVSPDLSGGGPVYNIPVEDWSKDDFDGDGLTFEREDKLGTCDSCFDSDQDGLGDMVEITGANVLVQVLGRPLLNRYCKTNPAYFDTDRDGRSDGEEILGVGEIVTDPLNPDTDGDSVPDGFDPQPLVPFSVDGNTMPLGWVNYWNMLGTEAGLGESVLSQLLLTSGDCDGDGVSNSSELLSGTQPLFNSSFCRAVFSDITKHPLSNCWNFSLKLYASHSVTGAVLLSKSNWSKGRLRGKDNYGLDKYLPEFPDYLIAPFVATPGFANNFSFLIDEHWLRRLATNVEYLRVYTLDYGVLSDTKSILLSGVPTPPGGFLSLPILTLPSDGEIYRDRTNTVFFSWSSSALTNVCCLSVADGNELCPIDLEITCAETNAFKVCAPGEYFWNVSGVNSNGRMFRSETRKFKVIWPDWDTDHDGYSDEYEIGHGSDWNDSNSVPVSVNCQLEFSSPAECLTSQELKACNGVPPYEWTVVSGGLPTGMDIIDGSLQGTPEFEGEWGFKIRVTDNRGSFDIKDFIYHVTPKRENTLLKFGKGKFIPFEQTD